MSRKLGECSLMTEIAKTEEVIKVCYEKIEALERRLRAKDFPSEKEADIENELVECRKLLRTNEQLLSTMHKDNITSFTFGIATCLILFLIWMLYILVSGRDF